MSTVITAPGLPAQVSGPAGALNSSSRGLTFLPVLSIPVNVTHTLVIVRGQGSIALLGGGACSGWATAGLYGQSPSKAIVVMADDFSVRDAARGVVLPFGFSASLYCDDSQGAVLDVSARTSKFHGRGFPKSAAGVGKSSSAEPARPYYGTGVLTFSAPVPLVVAITVFADGAAPTVTATLSQFELEF